METQEPKPDLPFGENPNPINLWKDYQILPSISRWQIGPVQLAFCESGEDILVHHSVEGNSIETKPDVLTSGETEIQWERWCFGTKVKTLTIHPMMPDRPLLVFTSDVINLPVKAKVTLYVSIPAVIKAFVKTGKSESILCAVPSQTLSNSWFGTHFEGELCYALKSPAQREAHELDWSDNTVICPVEIRNNADTPFRLERLCIRPRFLNIYAGTQRLWTNRVLITYRGENDMSKIDYQVSPPAELKKPTKLVTAEEAVPNGLIKRTFYNFVSSIN